MDIFFKLVTYILWSLIKSLALNITHILWDKSEATFMIKIYRGNQNSCRSLSDHSRLTS